jgi:hypothetical protein
MLTMSNHLSVWLSPHLVQIVAGVDECSLTGTTLPIPHDDSAFQNFIPLERVRLITPEQSRHLIGGNMKFSFATTAEISGDWRALDVTVEAADGNVSILAIDYIDAASGKYYPLPETEWTDELTDKLISDGRDYARKHYAD